MNTVLVRRRFFRFLQFANTGPGRCRRRVGLLASLLLLAALTPAIAQETCGTNPATAPNNSANYILGSGGTDGMAMHWTSGLVWKRCAESQSWDGSTCTGTATKKPWNDWMANYMPKPFADLAHWWTPVSVYTPPSLPTSAPNRLLTGAWRLPYKNALLGLATGCQNGPAINRNVFPNTPSSFFWSGSPYASYSDYAWVVDFLNGNAYSNGRNYFYRVRLVRGGQSFDLLTSPPSQTAPAHTIVTFGAITLQASDAASGHHAWGGARIHGAGNPQFEVNNSGQWVTEAIVTSGDTIRMRLTSGAAGVSRTATLILHSADTVGTNDSGSNGGDETATLRETTADFTVQVLPSYTLSYHAGPGGTLSGDTSQVVVQGHDGTTVTAVPDAQHHFVSWDDGVTTAARTDTNVSADINVTANFAIDSYTVTASAPGGHGLITPASQSVDHGQSASFIVTPDTGYHVASVTGDTCNVTGSGSSYSVANITADCAVTATFAITSYTATASAPGGHGTITPAAQSVDHGQSASFAVSPATGYHVTGVTGDSCTPVQASGNQWTATKITADCAVTASFAITSYTVTASAPGGHGSITPASQTVPYGDTVSFTLAPASGWEVTSVSGCGGSLSGDTYTTGPVTADCHVTASYTRIPVPVPMLGWRGLLSLLAGMTLFALVGVQRRRPG